MDSSQLDYGHLMASDPPVTRTSQPTLISRCLIACHFICSFMYLLDPYRHLLLLTLPIIQVVSLRFSNLIICVVLIYLECYVGLSGSPYLALVRPFIPICNPITALCSSAFVIFKLFCILLWLQLDGFMFDMSIPPVNGVLLVDIYSSFSSFIEFVPSQFQLLKF